MTSLTQITDASFDANVLKNDLIVIASFGAEWCVPCQTIASTLKQIVTDYADQVKIAELDIEQNPNTTAHYGVLELPTLLIFKNGQVIGRITGTAEKEKIVRTFSPYLVKQS